MLTEEEKLDVIGFGYEESVEKMQLVYPGDDDYNENLPLVPDDETINNDTPDE